MFFSVRWTSIFSQNWPESRYLNSATSSKNKRSPHDRGRTHNVCKMLTQEEGRREIISRFGKFSIVRGRMEIWGSVVFSCLQPVMTTAATRPRPPYSATQMWIFLEILSHFLFQSKKKWGMGMNSSDVDIRTRLIPCRCGCELREGTLRERCCCCCSRATGKAPVVERVQWIMRGKWLRRCRPVTAGSDRPAFRKEQGGDPRTHCFHSLQELLVCAAHEQERSSQSDNFGLVFCFVFWSGMGLDICSCFSLDINPQNEVARSQHSKH